ncbi:hypothetical protein N0V90_002111 [Kalmusia sp. IMI 367209]|nr:hypothetical protein N0V90_002111 [Kalmusia sp. IMI 367209]
MSKSVLPEDFRLVVAYSIYSCIYNLYFHPLAHIPGPFWARATPIPYILHIRNGLMVPWVQKLHKTYGDVIRIAPTEASFITGESAWQDIYGFRTGKNKSESYQKSREWYPVPISGAPSMLIADDANHSRMRKNLSHAFSDRALRDQETLVQDLVNLLVSRLHEEAEAGKDVDIMMWYNYTTFDVITDLTFGEPLGNLRDRGYHSWVNLVFGNLKAGGIMAMRRKYPMVNYMDNIMGFFTDNSAALRARLEFGRVTTEKVNQRVDNGTSRPDFFSAVLKNIGNDEKGLSRPEMVSNAILLMVAGSETTATLLSGATFLILQNPAVYKKMVNEIRTRFSSADDITFEEVSKLDYTIAVLQESLRYYPPVPTGFPRVVPKGGDRISGHYVPEGTSVYVSQHAANHSERNWTEPDTFAPERWMKDAPAKYKDDNHASMNAFSFGPRNCLGKNLAYAEMRLIMAKVLWHFDLEMKPESEGWLERHRLFMLWEKPSLMVKLKPVER